MTKAKRVHSLNQKDVGREGYVCYVMSRDQRVAGNHALLRAQELALEAGLPLVVIFCIFKTGVRSKEHYDFMLGGLKEVEADLETLSIPFLTLLGSPKVTLMNTFRSKPPAAIVFDFNSLVGPRNLQKFITENIDCKVERVDAHNIVPVWVASDKQEYAAATIRRKIQKHLAEFIQPYEDIVRHPYKSELSPKPLTDLSKLIDEELKDVSSSGIVVDFKPGPNAAQEHLDNFINAQLLDYADLRNDPADDSLSNMSPYLHYGHISALTVALQVNEAVSIKPELQESADSFLEELIIRKELSDNFCFYNKNHKAIEGAAEWAQKTLKDHAGDLREYVYSLDELQMAATHDPAWNAAQNQLMQTGKMHGYMRMYWAKKVLEWSEAPQSALDKLVYLNDFYSIDGGDPNGYVGILWSVAGVHDRGWTERPIFGKIRYMNYAGLKRKFKINDYEKAWNKQ